MNGKVYYYFTENEDIGLFSGGGQTFSGVFDIGMGLPTSFIHIPCIGTNTDINDHVIFRGTLYLFSLASSCLKSAFGAAKLDYLIDFVLPPLLVHRGTTLHSIENADWRGIQCATNENLEYLIYDGPILKAGEDQLNRYSNDIESQIPNTAKSSGNATAYEIAKIEENFNTLRVFIIRRFLTYCKEVVLLAQQYGLTDINSDFNIIFYNPDLTQFNSNKGQS